MTLRELQRRKCLNHARIGDVIIFIDGTKHIIKRYFSNATLVWVDQPDDHTEPGIMSRYGNGFTLVYEPIVQAIIKKA